MLTYDEIRSLFDALNDELKETDIVGELYLVGGAVMTLVFKARPSTHDVDGIFVPVATMRSAAAKVATQHDISPSWLNDAVKGYLSERGSFSDYLDLSNLKVNTAQPEYLLAMKCLSMRLGPEFHDESDIRYLLRYLNVEAYDQAKELIQRFYPLERFPQKTLYALEEILEGGASPRP